MGGPGHSLVESIGTSAAGTSFEGVVEGWDGTKNDVEWAETRQVWDGVAGYPLDFGAFGDVAA